MFLPIFMFLSISLFPIYPLFSMTFCFCIPQLIMKGDDFCVDRRVCIDMSKIRATKKGLRGAKPGTIKLVQGMQTRQCKHISQSVSQSFNRSIDQSIIRSFDRSVSQSINHYPGPRGFLSPRRDVTRKRKKRERKPLVSGDANLTIMLR